VGSFGLEEVDIMQPKKRTPRLRVKEAGLPPEQYVKFEKMY